MTFILGVVVGAIIGFFAFALMASASRRDEEDERRREKDQMKTEGDTWKDQDG